ncbi:MAG: YeiH family putative sulfate export transporter [Rhodobacteraceae bacterium]|nr:YeiH family putative sulfate export transporter [Paracoccaceae bacterium]
MTWLRLNGPGILLTAAVALPAWLLGNAVPVVGGPVAGMLLGMLLAFRKRPPSREPGIRYTSKKLLQLAIILLGFEMNLHRVLAVGHQTLWLMAFTLTAAFAAAWAAGRLLGVDGNSRTLIGVGTAICGGSAIAATAPVIGAKDEEVARAISTICLFNVAAAFIFPALGHLLGMSDQAFGLWAGTAVNDTSSVVAAGYAFSPQAGDLAVIVKLTRTLTIVPVTLGLALLVSRRQAAGDSGYSFVKVFPWFVLGFLAASVAGTFLPLPVQLPGLLARTGKYLIVMAMAAIGLNTHLPKLLHSGRAPLLLGFICWGVLSLTALAALRFFVH